MVHFRVVADHVIDFLGIDNLGDVANQLVGERGLHRVDQGHFLVNDQKRIVAGAPIRGVAVKIPDVPVDDADIIDAVCNFRRFHEWFPIIVELARAVAAGHFKLLI